MKSGPRNARSREQIDMAAFTCRRASRICRTLPLILRRFSSRQVVVRETQPEAQGGAPPITSDPPRHRLARMKIMPPFSGHEIKKLIPRTREICNHLIDQFADKGAFDGAEDYAQNIPVHVIAHMLAIPEADADQFRKWIRLIVIDGVIDDEAMHTGLYELTNYFLERLPERRANPGDDIISFLLQQTYDDGEPLKENHVTWIAALDPGCWYRHNMECDWCLDLALGQQSSRSRTARRRAGTDEVCSRGVLARLRSGDDGAVGGQRH